MFDAKMGSKKNANFTNFWKIEYAEKMNNGLSLVAAAFKTFPRKAMYITEALQ
jgi:hypothetical protein